MKIKKIIKFWIVLALTLGLNVVCVGRTSDQSVLKIDVNSTPSDPPEFLTAKEQFDKFESDGSEVEFLKSGKSIDNWNCISNKDARGTISLKHVGESIEVTDNLLIPGTKLIDHRPFAFVSRQIFLAGGKTYIFKIRSRKKSPTVTELKAFIGVERTSGIALETGYCF